MKYEWQIFYFELPSLEFCSVTVGGFFKTYKEFKRIQKEEPTMKAVGVGLVFYRKLTADLDTFVVKTLTKYKIK